MTKLPFCNRRIPPTWWKTRGFTWLCGSLPLLFSGFLHVVTRGQALLISHCVHKACTRFGYPLLMQVTASSLSLQLHLYEDYMSISFPNEGKQLSLLPSKELGGRDESLLFFPDMLSISWLIHTWYCIPNSLFSCTPTKVSLCRGRESIKICAAKKSVNKIKSRTK